MFAAPIVSQLPLPLLNFICTNVPGPQKPMYMLGRKMLTCYPYVPIGGEMGMNCAVLTYNGRAFVGFTCDVPATPDSEATAQVPAGKLCGTESGSWNQKQAVGKEACQETGEHEGSCASCGRVRTGADGSSGRGADADRGQTGEVGGA